MPPASISLLLLVMKGTQSFCSCLSVSDVGEVDVGGYGRGDTLECLISLILWDTDVVCCVSGRSLDGDAVSG